MALAMESYHDYNGSMRSPKAKAFFNRTADVLEWMLAVVLLLGGVSTMLNEATGAGTPLQNVFGSKITLVVFGVGFMVLGATIIYTKVRRRRLALARTLMVSYLVLLFAFIIEAYIFHSGLAETADSLLFTIIAAILYLREKHSNRQD